jgi:hypothetical protein
VAEKQKILTLDVDGQPVTITVARASAKAGIKRYRLMLEEREEPDEDMKYVRFILYPNLIAGTLSATGIPWPPTVEQVAELDEALVNEWMASVYEVNPNWEPRRRDDAEKNG